MAAANSGISKFCKVADCRFASEHVTAEHSCGFCQTKGHGQIECVKPNARSRLDAYRGEILPIHLHCTRPKCESSNLHTINGHFCNICLPLKTPFSSKQHSSFNCDNNPEYIARRTAELNISTEIKTHKLICPVCRTENEYSNNNISSSLQEIKCCVCIETDKKLIFLPTCKHFNLCTDCAELIREPSVVDSRAAFSGLISFGPDTDYNVLNDFATKHFKGRDGKLYMQLYAGMGWSWFVRRHRIGEIVEVLITDGMFDEPTMINKFIDGYTQVEQQY